MSTIGKFGDELSGVESRALRAALNLERRHVAVLVTAAGLWGKGACSTSDVNGWERSKGRGYPRAVVDDLMILDAAVSGLATILVEGSERDEDGAVATLRRPRGPMRVHQLLRLRTVGLEWGPDVIAALDQEGGDFWDCLADAAVTRAALDLNHDEWRTRVVLDKED